MAAFYQYLLAVGYGWFAIMGAVAFMTGDLAGWFGFRDWLDKHLPAAKRRPIEIAIMIAVVFWAGFDAWSDQKDATDKAEGELITASKLADTRLTEIQGIDGNGGLRGQNELLRQQLADARNAKAPQIVMPTPSVKVELTQEGTVQRHLTEEQKQKLKAAMQPLAKDIPAILIFYADGNEAGVFAHDFYLVLKSAGIDVPALLNTAALEYQRGVLVGVADPKNPSELAKKFFAALSDAGFDPHYTDWLQPVGVGFDLFIGR